MSSVDDLRRASLDDPDAFWGEAARAIDWTVAPRTVLDRSREPFVRWFPDGELNTAWNCIDRHVEGGRADQLALVYDSPVTDQVRRFTYRQVQDEVARLAGALRGLGVERGDRVVLYMPMVPEAVFGMLACARLGAVHSVVFGGFAPRELAIRIDDAQPKVMLSASCGIEGQRVIAYKPLLDDAIGLARHQPDACVILQRPQAEAPITAGRDHDWADLVAAARPVDCVPVQATDPLYILYTSGTTGLPKGVVRDNGGHAVALAWSMPNVYDARPGDVYWAASDVGWVVGHSYIVYAPLLHGCTTILYEGKPVGTPDAGAFWRVVAEHGVRTLFTAPTAFRAIKKEDPDRGAPRGARPEPVRGAVPGRRADRHRHLPLGRRPARRAGDRPLVADRDRVADRGQLPRHRGAAREARLADEGRAGLRRAGAAGERGGRRRRTRRARSRSGCRSRPGRCRRSGTTTSGSCPRTWSCSRATT